MKGKTVLLITLAMALSSCGLVELEGEVLNPTDAADLQSVTTEISSEVAEVEKDEEEPLVIAGVLPAPVIFLQSEGEAAAPGKQNLWRLEVDGITASQITDEPVPVSSFAISPVDGSIVYTTFSENDLVRVDWDGVGRNVLLDGDDLSVQPEGEQGARISIANPTWSPDGGQVAFAYGGIQVISSEGGAPRMLLEDHVVSDSGRVSQESRYYWPIAWSPDGGKILVGEGYGIEGSGYAVVDVLSGNVVSLDSAVLCCEASWSLDSQGFYFSSAAYGMVQPGLWYANALTGEITTLIRGMESAGLPDVTGEPMSLIQSAKQLVDGELYAFAGFGTYDELYRDEAGNEIAPKFTMTQFSAEGTNAVALRPDTFSLGEALWAEDASGAVITVIMGEEYPSGTLLWVASDGSAPVVLVGRGFQPRWGQAKVGDSQ